MHLAGGETALIFLHAQQELPFCQWATLAYVYSVYKYAHPTTAFRNALVNAMPQVSYVLDTEDVFRRRGKKAASMAPEVAAKKSQRFQSWANMQQKSFMLQQQQLHAQLVSQQAPMSAF